MITNVNELADKINAFVNCIVKEACENTSSGNYIFEEKDIKAVCAACNMSYDDYLKYNDLIEDEISSREELLDYQVEGCLIDFMCGLSYCPNYEWCQGDETIFGSYEEFENRVVTPVEQKKSITELAEIGAEVIKNYPDVSKEIQVKNLISSLAPGQVFCEATTERYIYLKEKLEDDFCLFNVYNNDLEFSHKKFILNKVVAEEIYNGAFTFADDKKAYFESKERKSLDERIKECEEKKGSLDDGPDGPGDIAPARGENEAEERSI